MGVEVDRLVSVDVTAGGVIRHLFQANQKLLSKPACLEAALRLKEKVRPSDVVFVLTGFPDFPPSFIQETDGPLGACALARILHLNVQAVPIVLTEQTAVRAIESTCTAMELNVVPTSLTHKVKSGISVLPYPLDEESSKRRATELLDEFNPAAIISIEKVSKNYLGEYHTIGGSNVSRASAKTDHIFEQARTREIVTIGIGDGGNEVGMGNIIEDVRKYVPTGSKCHCPCNGGVASVTKADVLVTSVISNWGAFGVEACIASIYHRPETIHNSELERKALNASISSGAIDGKFGVPMNKVDGMSETSDAGFVEILRELAMNHKAIT